MAKPRFDKEPICCCVCRRAAHGIGYTPRSNAPVAWTCDDPDCIRLGRAVYNMLFRDFTAYEQRALTEAGEAAGGYLETLGKTDLATLTEDEWADFLATVLKTFGERMRTLITSGTAPF